MVRPVALVGLILTLSSTALAQPSLTQPLAQPASPAPEREVEVTSYRNHILIASGIGVAALFGGAMAEGEGGRDTDESDMLFGLGFATTFLAPPVIHFAHGELGRGIGSFGLRWGGAFAGGLIAMQIENCNPDTDGWFCDLEAFAPGALAGVAIASLVDAFTLTDQTRVRERAPQRVFAPVLAASSTGGQIGLAGTF